MHPLLKPVRSFFSSFENLWRLHLEKREWDRRIANVVACSDNALLPRVPDAGVTEDGWQVMHNGLMVAVDGYYGNGITRMLKINKGSHEPQEEVVFAEVLKKLPDSPVMIECGAYWSFYSMWFLQCRPGGHAYMIEPVPANLEVGQKNFQRNGLTGDFLLAGISRDDGMTEQGLKLVSIPSFMKSRGLHRVDILHMDIQGAELEALRGAELLFVERLINYAFVSTHSETLHEECIQFLQSAGYVIQVSIPLSQSCSVDGVIVAHAPLIASSNDPDSRA